MTKKVPTPRTSSRSKKSSAVREPSSQGHASASFDRFIERCSSILFSPVAVMVGLGLAIYASYHRVIPGPFLFDDVGLMDGGSIQKLWPIWAALWGPSDTATAGRPLVNLSFALNYAFGEFDPPGYHLVNIVVHWMNACLVLVLVGATARSLLFFAPWKNHGSFVAAAIAFVWALHPIQSEAVGYISQRTELMMAFFFLATVYAAKRAWDARAKKSSMFWQCVSITACGLGMMCKEVMAVAPVMIILYDLAFHEKSWRALLNKRWRLYVGLFSTWPILLGLLATNPRGESAGFSCGLSVVDYLRVQCWAVPHYLWQSFVPVALVGDYGHFRPVGVGRWLPGLMILVLLAGFTLWLWRRHRPTGFLGGWFFLILAPSSSFIPIVTEPIAERRMYLPLLAVVALPIFGFFALLRHWKRLDADSDEPRSQSFPLFVCFTTTVLSVVLAVATHARNEVFESELAFWLDVTRKQPENVRGFDNLGVVYAKLNRPEQAFAAAQKAVSLSPNDASAVCNFATRLSDQGRFDEALKLYERVIASNADVATAHFNRGLICFRTGRFEEAVASFETAIRLKPHRADAYVAIADAQIILNRLVEAEEDYRKAVELNPRSKAALSNLAVLLNGRKEYGEAVAMCRQALAVEPASAAEFRNLGIAFTGLEDHASAAKAFQESLQLNSQQAQVWFELGQAFRALKKNSEAESAYQQAVVIDPKYAEAVNAVTNGD